jgi:hypothetical protein
MQRHKQLLYAGSSSSSVQLVEHLITTALARGHWEAAPMLAATPAAQQLGLQQVLQLLALSIQMEPFVRQVPRHELVGNEGPVDIAALLEPLPQRSEAPCCAALCALPAAQSISASTIASLLRLAAKQKRYEWGRLLCRLPAAQQLPSQQLRELLLQLLLLPQRGYDMKVQQQLLTKALSRLQAAREVPPDAAMQLLSTLIQTRASDNQRACSVLEDAHKLGVLAAVGSQLTGVEQLQLLQQAADLGSGDAVRYIAALEPAEDIDDAAGFAAFMQDALVKVENDVWQYAVRQLPVWQQLGPDAVLSLLQACISRRSSSGVPATLVYRLAIHPAVATFSTAALEQLLLAAAEQHQLGGVAVLLKAPAAAGLSAEAVADLLQHAAHEMCDKACGLRLHDRDTRHELALESFHSLLALPAAQQLPPCAVVSVLSAAIEAQDCAAIGRALDELPSAQQISAGEAAALLQRAEQHGFAVWKVICSGLPQLGHPQPTSEQLCVFLQHAIALGDDEGVSELCQLAAEAEAAAAAAAATVVKEDVAACGISATDMKSLLLEGLHQSRYDVPTALQREAAAQLFQLDAAKTLEPDAVADLMMACVRCRDVSGVTLVAQLPAAAQLNQQAAEAFVQAALDLDSLRTSEDFPDSDVEEVEKGEAVLCALLQQPAVQCLAPDAVARLLAMCIEGELHASLQRLCSELTAAKQGDLGQDGVRQLLQCAYEMGQWKVFDWLLGLPSAPLGDEEVAMWRAVRAVTACQSARWY